MAVRTICCVLGVYKCINSSFVQWSEFILTDLDVHGEKAGGFWFLSVVSAWRLFFCGSKKQRNAQFPCQTAKLFRCGVCLKFWNPNFLRQLSLQLVQDIPQLYKNPFSRKQKPTKNTRKDPVATPRPDACPQPGAEKKKRCSERILGEVGGI